MGCLTHFQARLRDWIRRHRVARLPYAHKGINVTLHNGSLIDHPENIWLGDDIYLGPQTNLWADASITIHDNVIFGPQVTVITANHRIEGATMLPYGPLSELGPVEIFSNVWIGAQCLILPGVRIGEGAICAAGSVVTRSVPPLAMVAGNPACVKRYRDPAHYMKLKQDKQFYLRAKAERGGLPIVFVPRPEPAGPMREDEAAIRQRAQLHLADYEFEG